ncbi:MAG: diguanylate cyclase [Phycisphaerae bacterium]
MVRHENETLTDQPQLSAACARRAGLACACSAIVAFVAFSIVADRLVNRLTAQAVKDRARVCAAVLESSPDGDFHQAAEHLRDRYRPLVAIASIGARGGVEWMGAACDGYERVANAALAGGGAAVPLRIFVNGSPDTFWGVVVPLNGDEAPSSRRVLFLFRHPRGASSWVAATAAFGCAVLIGSFVGVGSFIRWFRRRVGVPLANLGRPISREKLRGEPGEQFDGGGWRETERIASNLCGLSRSLATSEAAVRRIKLESECELQARERGFDRRLRRAEDLAMIDPLTGLRNRTYLDVTLPRVLAAQRAGAEHLSVVMIDMDNFKKLNDRHGHKAGDELLRCTGELLRASIRPSDHAVRYGGDEFLLLLPGVDVTEAQQITERVLKLFARSAVVVDLSRSVTLSAGVASDRGDRCDDGWRLITEADAALYTAKRAGKNAVAVYSMV